MTVQRAWSDLVVENPMLIEITRFRRKFLSVNGSNSMSAVILVLVAVCYFGLVMMVFSFRTDTDPIALVMFQTVIFNLAAPLMLNSSIAGERERRSWDLLLAAPITKAQIVVGKFMGALAAFGVGTLAFLVPIFISAASYQRTNLWNLFLAELVSLSFTALVCALTMLFSARVKRSFMALGASLGTLIVAIAIVPALLGVLIGGADHYFTDVLMFLHPVQVLTRLDQPQPYGEIVVPSSWFGFPQTVCYLAFAGVLLGWAIQTLNFAENEVKFLPQTKS